MSPNSLPALTHCQQRACMNKHVQEQQYCINSQLKESLEFYIKTCITHTIMDFGFLLQEMNEKQTLRYFPKYQKVKLQYGLQKPAGGSNTQ